MIDRKLEEKIVEYNKKEAKLLTLSESLAQMKAQLLEVERTLEELSQYEEPYVYKLQGGILIKVKTEKAKEDLEKMKALLSSRIAALEKEVESLSQALERLRKALEEELQQYQRGGPRGGA
ncbi:MAG: hypothetical protein GXN92_02435 [Candidatus Micrarchaeota archaeon]|nr:hypothetical protein [Candidatus Micrarchaeota archaeon]